MHYAVLGCIHGNADALRAVLNDIRARSITRIVCLGDVAAQGPDPMECLDLVRQHCYLTIRGEEDDAILSGADALIPRKAKAIDWIREELDEERRAFLESAKLSHTNAGISFHHGSPRSTHEYLFASDVEHDPRKLRAAFAETEKVSFVAHTHIPGVMTDGPLTWHSAEEISGSYHYRKGSKAIINVGSVGQPRDGDPRACYLEIQKNTMCWRRVAFDVERVA